MKKRELNYRTMNDYFKYKRLLQSTDDEGLREHIYQSMNELRQCIKHDVRSFIENGDENIDECLIFIHRFLSQLTPLHYEDFVFLFKSKPKNVKRTFIEKTMKLLNGRREQGFTLVIRMGEYILYSSNYGLIDERSIIDYRIRL